MQIKITSYYPTLNIGEITCNFDVEVKHKPKGDLVSACFIDAVYADNNNELVPLSLSDLKNLEGGDIYEFFREDAIEEFYEQLRSHPVVIHNNDSNSDLI
jgi:hypothetical protein